MAVTTSCKESFISTTSAESMAMSVPAPMAMPISALVRAGASLMPSPTMATLCPFSCQERTQASFSVGSTSDTASAISSSFRIASAVTLLSPVSMTTVRPISLNFRMAARLVSRTVSATAMIPAACPSRTKRSGVFPWDAYCPIFSLTKAVSCSGPIAFSSSIKARLPAIQVFPEIRADTPRPVRAWKSSA